MLCLAAAIIHYDKRCVCYKVIFPAFYQLERKDKGSECRTKDIKRIFRSELSDLVSVFVFLNKGFAVLETCFYSRDHNQPPCKVYSQTKSWTSLSLPWLAALLDQRSMDVCQLVLGFDQFQIVVHLKINTFKFGTTSLLAACRHKLENALNWGLAVVLWHKRGMRLQSNPL